MRPIADLGLVLCITWFLYWGAMRLAARMARDAEPHDGTWLP